MKTPELVPMNFKNIGKVGSQRKDLPHELVKKSILQGRL